MAREAVGLYDRIAAAEPDAARRLAHRLKGAAGNLGLLEVAARAGDFEQRLTTEDAPERLAAARTALQTALTTALDSIARYAPEAPSQTLPVPKSPDRAALVPLVRAALAAMRDFDPIGAEPILAELAARLPTERLAPVRQAVDNLDATSGVAALLWLAHELSLSLEEAS